MSYQILNENCLTAYEKKLVPGESVDVTFLDPPFNQQKDYTLHNDDMDETAYWEMMKKVCLDVYKATKKGGALYFMQREKNTEFVLRTLRETGWAFQNLIIWKKKTSAVPVPGKYSKQYQVIAFAIKGEKAKTFNRLRIDPELPASYKVQREKGLFLTDVWEDIRELTAGYFAGNEAIRNDHGERFHKQQTSVALMLRIILTSSKAGDTIFDPFAGTGTTLVVAHQLHRKSIGIEIDPVNTKLIKDRLLNIREADLIQKYYKDYRFTDNLAEIWGNEFTTEKPKPSATFSLFDN